jgi:hypothetical protein
MLETLGAYCGKLLGITKMKIRLQIGQEKSLLLALCSINN